MQGRKRKLNYEKIYGDILKADENKKIFQRKTEILKSKKYFPRTYRDIAEKYNISPNQVSLIKKLMLKNGKSM